MGQARAKTENIAFEDALARLEVLVDALEAGDIPLNELVEKYEEGSKLIKHCNSKLSNAELKIQQLRQDGAHPNDGNDAESPQD
ncbi:MAG: exodeoxyribonuclease VII small subunit [Verrucomicrobiota bacterium]